MASYNRIVLVGNLTRDPQLSYTPQNTAVCKFGIATSRSWKDREGNTREETCFVDCTAFGKAGEVFNQYMAKGRQVLVEGRLSLNQWTTPEGDKRSKHEIIVENFTFLGARGGDGGAAPRDGQRSAAPAAARDDAGYDEPPQGGDIPF
jgi:single-strand DNA-binding protein